MCHILGIEPQFENIIKNGLFIPMTAGQRKPEGQWIRDDRKATNLDQRLKSVIMYVLPDDQMNSVINCLTAKSTWDDLILYHEGPADVKESRVMNLKLCYNTFKFKEAKSLTQTFTRYKALMNELVNDGIKLSKLEINTGFINGLQKKWLSFCQSLKNTNHVKDSELTSLFDSPDDEEDTRSSHEYLNDLEEVYQTRALLAKSKRFFKKELRPTKDFEAKYKKVKAKLALLSSSALASKAITIKNKGLIVEAYKWDEEEVSSDENEMVEVKVLMTLAEENDAISKEGARNGEWVKISMRKLHTLLEMEDNDDRKTYLDYLCINLNYVEEQRNNLLSKHRDLKRILRVDQLIEDPSSSGQKDLVFVKSSANDTKVSIPGVERPWLSKAKDFILPNHDTGRILLAESQRNTTDPPITVIDSSATDYDLADESSVCRTPLPPLKKLDGVEPVFGPKTIKSILRSKSTFKSKTLNGVIINEPSLAPANGNKSSSTSKVNSAPDGKLKSVKIKDDPPLAIVMKELNDLKLQISKNQSSYSKNNQPQQHVMKSCETCGSIVHTTTDHNDIEWFRRGEELKAKKPKALKSTKAESSNTNRSKTSTRRHMTGVKSYLHKYVEQPGPKVVFRDDSTGTTEGYGSIKCNEKRKNLQFNKEVVMIAPRVRDVYVLDMTSSAQESCFFAKASDNLNWLWHKRLAHLKIKTINKLAKQNLVIGLPSLTSSIKKCLHLLYMDLFRPITPRFINYEKYTLVIVDEYSRYTWVYFLKKKSQAPKTIMSFIKRVENQNNIKVKQLRTDNGTEFRNRILVNFCDEKGISQNFSSPYTPEQNGFAKRKNKTLIEAAKIMLSGSVFSKQYWTEGVATACYTQNRSTIMKRHLKTPYEIFHKRIPNINFLHVFGCLVFIHNHKDHLGKFDEKANDGYLLGYSLVSKAFRVFNTRRQQTKETYHVTFNESPGAIKFSKPLVDDINIAETKRYPPDEYLHPYEPSQRYQTNSNYVSFIEPYECLELVVLETKVSSDQNGQTDQSAQTDEILNDISEHLSSPSVEDTSVQNTIPILNSSLSIPSMVTSAPQDRWSKDKHIELVNIIGNPGAGMLIRAIAKQLSAALAHECLFVDFLSEEEPKKVFEALQHPGWVDAMQDELNQFARNKVWTLVPAPYGKTIIGSKWIKQSKRGILINQEKYVKDLLKKYDINDSLVKTSMVPPNKLGPDLNGKDVNETQYRGFDLKGYSDSDYAECNMDGKSTLAAAGCCANILWMKSQLTDYDIIYEKVPILCDNTSAITISNNSVMHSRTKHIDIKYHFIKYYILKRDIELHFIPNQYQLVDIFTKPLDETTFKRLIVKLDLVKLSFEEIALTTNNEVKLLYPSRSNSKYFKTLDDSKIWVSTPTGGIREDIGTNTSVLVNKTKSAKDGLKTAHTDSGTNEESRADEISKKIKLKDLSDLIKDIRFALFTLDSLQDEPIIVLDESKEEETKKDEDTNTTSHDVLEDTSVPHPPSPKSAQIQELMAQVHSLQSQKEKLEQQKAKAEAEVASLKARTSYPDINQLTELLVTSLEPELSKLLASHDFASCLPTELKELPSKFTKLSGDIKELTKHV
ncbi:retrovirus-related pol polyprotein from transposon TNT 1-94 [Tanacetum coccineum]